MGINKKRNRNYEKTEEAIKNTLIKLYYEKGSIRKITVKELCEESNISKSTFYLHYVDMMTIFETVGAKFVYTINEMIGELIKNQSTDFHLYIEIIFGLIKESSELIKIGLSSEYPFSYIEKLKKQLENVLVSYFKMALKKINLQILYETRIVVSGLIDFVISLIRNTDKEEINKYIPYINNFLMRWVNSIEKIEN